MIVLRLPYDLLSQNYIKPKLFLCETNKQKICELDTIDMKASLKFNAYSELTFTVPRTYTNMITGKTQVNPFYNKIEALRLVYLQGFGYFEIQEPEIESDGIREAKNVTAYSLEYTLAQKYLEEFYINTGEINSVEVINSDGVNIVPVTLYNESDEKLSLLHLILEKIYGWTIGHVDESLKTLGRTFEISRASVYDFIVKDICEKFNCFAVFDTINNTINLYAEALSTKFISNGETNIFILNSPYTSIGSVTINSYKTTAYTYEISTDFYTGISTGILTLDEIPQGGAVIEITDGSQEQWSTDVYVSFDNLAQEVNVSYKADDIKTVLTIKGADNLDIREVNMGLPYLVDLSYYYSVDWMGQDLYEAYTKYLQNCDSGQVEYQKNSEEMLALDGYVEYEQGRLSLQYSIADNVTSTTVGTYYVRGGTEPDYYYSEVKLPDDWKTDTTYYMLSGSDLDETKFSKFYEALKKYYTSGETDKLLELKEDFKFVESYTIDNLSTDLKNATSLTEKDDTVKKFLNIVWDQIGLTPLNELYYRPYVKIKETNEEAKWNEESNANYWNYYPVTVVLSSLEAEIVEREEIIAGYEDQYNALVDRNAKISNNALIYNNFTYEQLVRLNPFLREDEYTDDQFVETKVDTVETLMQTKKELMECGRIELQKLSSPQLEFSMDMANIYALKEFEPIIDQFQLGNLINVVIRSDYVKRARLLKVDINFDDFSDFSCDFGELTSLRTPSSIHADLLSTALTAGKSVASNASYWNKTSDSVMSLRLQLQKGLLDAATIIKAIDGNQGVEIDSTGIHLRKYDPDTGAIDPKEGWIVNNQFLYSDDNFKTTKSVFGEYTIDGQVKWGLLAEAIMAGHVAGCTIEGGVIKIGLQPDDTYAFEVHSDGSVTMNGGSTIAGYAKEDYVDSQIQELKDFSTIISSTIPTDANEGQMWLDTSATPYSLMVFTNGEWDRFSKHGETVYTSEPSKYVAGDIWILGANEYYGSYGPGSILKADKDLNWVDAISDITRTIKNVKESFQWDDDGIKVMKRVVDDNGNATNPFYVHIDSTRMGFHSVEYNNGIATNDVEVVHVGNNSSVIQNATFQGGSGTKFENAATFERQINMRKPNTTTGFVWKIENNGSLSLSIT